MTERKSRFIIFLMVLALICSTPSVYASDSSQQNQEKIYNYMNDKLDYPNAMKIGILANMQAECSFNSSNLQGKYEKALEMTDAEYTKAVDNKEYSEDSFVNDHAGYGLCQWTYSTRKQKLYDYAEAEGVSISNYKMQLRFMDSEMSGAIKNAMLSFPNTEDGAAEAAKYFCQNFEKPADSNAWVKRAEIARKLYREYYPQKTAAKEDTSKSTASKNTDSKSTSSKSESSKKTSSKSTSAKSTSSKSSTAKTVTIDVRCLRVRGKASTSGKVLGSLKKGAKVKVTEVKGDWGKIEYNGKTGWIYLRYTK